MSRPSPETAGARLDAAWAELGDGRWLAARALFAAALADEELPEAHEGLSWAAWWLDDEKAVFGSRERAYRLYRERRDLGGAARMATWLAADELDFRGAVAVARGWLRRAHRLLDSLEPGSDHGWLAFHEGYIAHQSGDAAAARGLARTAAGLGRRCGIVDLEMLGLALEGASLVACAAVDEGMCCLDEAAATALAEDATIPISGAWACCFLVSACTAVHDYARASEWCDRIGEFAERYGSRYMLAFCRAEYGAVHLWRGRWSEAESMLESSVDDFSHARPAWVGAPLTMLAELRRRQGRYEDCVELLTRAGASAGAQVCRARLALDRGETRRALDLLERLLRRTSPERELDRVPALALLVRARVARGEIVEAGEALESLRESATRVGTPSLLADADLAGGMLAAAAGDHARARLALEDAVDGFERAGGPYEAAVARLELATTLLALAREDVAREEALAALDVLTDLGAARSDAERARRLLEVTDPAGVAAPVTPRERDVLGLLVEGLTNRQIAERLVVSEHTVHRHVTNILRKLGLPSRTAAAAYAVRSGLLD